MEHNKYRIEFTGIGGVGKSTIIKELLREFDKTNIEYDNLTDHTKYKISINMIIAMIKSVFVTLRMKPKSFHGLKQIYKGITIYYLLYSKIDRKNNIKVFDEGLIHKSRAIKNYSKIDDMLEIFDKLIGRNRLPDLLIIVESDANSIYKRRLKRNAKHDVFSFEQIKNEIMDDNFNQTIKTLQKYSLNNQMKVIRLRNDNWDDIEKSVSEIKKIVCCH